MGLPTAGASRDGELSFPSVSSPASSLLQYSIEATNAAVIVRSTIFVQLLNVPRRTSDAWFKFGACCTDKRQGSAADRHQPDKFSKRNDDYSMALDSLMDEVDKPGPQRRCFLQAV